MFDHEATAVEDYSDGVPIPLGGEDEDDVQIKLTPRGVWHRKLAGIPLGARIITTGCGESAIGYAHREAGYRGDLCPQCFTTFELQQATHLARAITFDDDITLTDDE